MAEKPPSFNLRSETHESVLKELKKNGNACWIYSKSEVT